MIDRWKQRKLVKQGKVYSPLASRHLVHLGWNSNTKRGKSDAVATGKYDRMEQFDYPIVERVHELAEKHGVQMAEIALAWEWAKGVTALIIGAPKNSHLDSSVKALDVKLTDDEVKYLDELYIPHYIVGANAQNTTISNLEHSTGELKWRLKIKLLLLLVRHLELVKWM